ncbi:MAG: DUF6323 family protein, partial [Eggerthellaceae bacterium]|nr:DUF6323 family protein [Eggerthellaceae bacterium]
ASFASSPYLAQTSFDQTLAELQDIFYHLKEETEEAVPDIELIAALRHIFDEEAHGALEILENLSCAKILKVVRQARQDANEDWSESDSYEEAGGEEEGLKSRDGLDRVHEHDRWERPGVEYAATFYDGAREVYRITADTNARIGGSSLG